MTQHASHIYLLHPTKRLIAPPVTNHDLTFAGNLSHLNEDEVTELSKLSEGLHPAADVHFILFSYVQAIDCLLGVRLHLQLKCRNEGTQRTKTQTRKPKKINILCFN